MVDFLALSLLTELTMGYAAKGLSLCRIGRCEVKTW